MRLHWQGVGKLQSSTGNWALALVFRGDPCYKLGMSIPRLLEQTAKRKSIYYGWVIVFVGFLARIASAFSISSTLSVFLKPLSADLGISRRIFSLIRCGEILIGAAAAPVVGTLMDRHGGRWLMAAGGLIAGAGFICLGQARDFIQFMLVRWLLVSPGDSLMGSMVVNVSIARWFVRMRGRALAIAGMGHGLAKVCMPVMAATLMLYVGWRGSWVVFAFSPCSWWLRRRCYLCAALRKKWDCCLAAAR
jgi:MFS family permease